MPKEEYPDFKELNDRVIAEAPEGPFISITTNLDSEDPLNENPYLSTKTSEREKEKLRKYFDETD
jgi:hypothetical protein